ncbi:ribosome-binding factor A [Candidatus Microgenomates bacterium]|nr:ribosome-binding factor A [Candidatus Microgenomates bacterium]
MKQRSQRMASIVQRVVGIRLHEVSGNPQLTITSVIVTPDLRHATVWVAVAEGVKDPEGVIEGLAVHLPELQTDLATHIRTKFTPKLSLRLDNSADHVARVENLLDEIGATGGKARS